MRANVHITESGLFLGFLNTKKRGAMYYLGLDVGSITTKAVLLSSDDHIVWECVVSTGSVVKKTISIVMDAAMRENNITIEGIDSIVSTGYGRKNVERAQKTITEITAHAYGAFHLFPTTALIIDIGGQDTKVICLALDGTVHDFVMNDKCAAGTGRFLEVMAQILEIPLEQFGERALSYTHHIAINSTCTVFAESEVISLIARGESVENIAFAIHDSVVGRIMALVKKMPLKGDIMLSGGVSKNCAIQQIIQSRLSQQLTIPENPQIIGALGAALFARKGCLHFQHNK